MDLPFGYHGMSNSTNRNNVNHTMKSEEYLEAAEKFYLSHMGKYDTYIKKGVICFERESFKKFLTDYRKEELEAKIKEIEKKISPDVLHNSEYGEGYDQALEDTIKLLKGEENN